MQRRKQSLASRKGSPPSAAPSLILKIWTARPLELGAVGDVKAARRLVEVLLEACEDPPKTHLSALLLTAVCLDLNARMDDEPYLADLTLSLITLFQDRLVARRFCGSPQPLVQYVGLEILDLSDAEQEALFAPLILQLLMIPQPRREELARIRASGERPITH